jgi:hypothetical protein
MAQGLLHDHPSVGLFLMAQAYSSDVDPFDALFPDDKVRAEAYVEVARRRSGLPPRELDHLDAPEKARVARIQQDLGSRQPGIDTIDRSLLDAIMGPGTTLGEDAGNACD